MFEVDWIQCVWFAVVLTAVKYSHYSESVAKTVQYPDTGVKSPETGILKKVIEHMETESWHPS